MDTGQQELHPAEAMGNADMECSGSPGSGDTVGVAAGADARIARHSRRDIAKDNLDTRGIFCDSIVGARGGRGGVQRSYIEKATFGDDE